MCKDFCGELSFGRADDVSAGKSLGTSGSRLFKRTVMATAVMAGIAGFVGVGQASALEPGYSDDFGGWDVDPEPEASEPSPTSTTERESNAGYFGDWENDYRSSAAQAALDRTTREQEASKSEITAQVDAVYDNTVPEPVEISWDDMEAMYEQEIGPRNETPATEPEESNPSTPQPSSEEDELSYVESEQDRVQNEERQIAATDATLDDWFEGLASNHPAREVTFTEQFPDRGSETESEHADEFADLDQSAEPEKSDTTNQSTVVDRDGNNVLSRNGTAVLSDGGLSTATFVSNDGGNDSDYAAPETTGPCVDHDGDGWGWDGKNSCRLTAVSHPGFPSCENGSASDHDGDGYGWENHKTCLV